MPIKQIMTAISTAAVAAMFWIGSASAGPLPAGSIAVLCPKFFYYEIKASKPFDDGWQPGVGHGNFTYKPKSGNAVIAGARLICWYDLQELEHHYQVDQQTVGRTCTVRDDNLGFACIPPK